MAALPTMGGDRGDFTAQPTIEQKQRYALRQCFLLAIRMARKAQKTDDSRSSEWNHIIRFCKDADEGGNICGLHDLDNLRHMVGTESKNPGYRNHFAPGGDDVESMKRLEQAGLVIKGRIYSDGVHFYHATLLGCKAAGLSKAATRRALRTR